MTNYLTRFNNNKRRYAHRIIMELHIGRSLTKSELVHHKNGDKTDNRIENLEIITRGGHASLHHKGEKKSLKWKINIQKSLKKWHKNKDKNRWRNSIKLGLKKKFPDGKIPWNKGKCIWLSKQKIIICACGCGEELKKYDKKGRIKKYIFGHGKRNKFKKVKIEKYYESR